MNKTIHSAIIVSLLLFVSNVIAQEKQPATPGACYAHCMTTNNARIRAADWVNAWQTAKESCTNANSMLIQMVDRSGPSFQGMKLFESVDLKASGELLVIKIKKGDKQEESVIIIRAADILRIEVSRRPFSQD